MSNHMETICLNCGWTFPLGAYYSHTRACLDGADTVDEKVRRLATLLAREFDHATPRDEKQLHRPPGRCSSRHGGGRGGRCRRQRGGGVMDLAGRHVAAPLYEAIGPVAFDAVARWLREVADVTALEVDEGGGRTRIITSSTAWLAETVSFYDHGTDS